VLIVLKEGCAEPLDRSKNDRRSAKAKKPAICENVDMDLYLMWRARRLRVETPAVRP
jgi:hypothetical protein